MNRTRRAEINKAIEDLRNVESNIEAIRDDEQDAYDEMTEGIQSGDRGDACIAAIDALESAIDLVGQAIDSMDEAAS